MRALTIALLLTAAGHAMAAKPAPAPPRIEQRAPTEEERNSFDIYFHQKMVAESHGARPVMPLFAPAFDIERQRGKPWQVIARVDSAPRHSAVDLCRQIRSSFIFDAKAPKDSRWSETAQEPTWHVWLAQPNTICSAVQHTVLMDQAVRPEDVVALLRQHAELLSRARLLFAGNSRCIRQRALPFTLRAIAPAAPAAGAPVMFSLVFESDRDTVARVAVRRHRGEYAAWNVDCD
ncbi:hypothetical protein [Rugamonas rivuli]|uniref:Uncharacterized protein n=1 Tax=Rugamonas rivuli TaxID=2743358 RepID=A0A843SBB6_9BURK|nr:hypothetical protein [Rugamonas rivuli]MQA19501.1 hypothetical protein [Rugamonas rivuli]